MIRNLLGLVLSGLSLGWLMGMSVTPVVKDVLMAVLAVVTTFLTAFAGISGNKQADNDNPIISRMKSFDAFPVGVFLVFLALGSVVGVLTRTNAVLGPSHRWLGKRWELDSAQQVRFRYQLLAATYNIPDSTGKPAHALPPTTGGILFSVKVRKFCDESQTLRGIELQDQLERQIATLIEKGDSRSRNKLIFWKRKLADEPTEADLQRIRTALCEPL